MSVGIGIGIGIAVLACGSSEPRTMPIAESQPREPPSVTPTRTESHPVVVPPPVPQEPPTPTVLASDEKRPTAIAVDSTALYWLTEKELKKFDLSTETSVTLATAKFQFTGGRIVLDGTSIYLAAPFGDKPKGIVRIPKSGGPAVQIADPKSFTLIDLAADNASLYWLDAGGRMMSVPKAGGHPKQLRPESVSALTLGGIAVDSSGIYWGVAGDLAKRPRSGYLMGTSPVADATATPTFFVDLMKENGGAPVGIAVDGEAVYWTDAGADGNGEKAIKKVAKAGGKVSTLATGSTELPSIALDSTFVYWASFGDLGVSNGAIMKVSKNGGPVTTLAAGQDHPNSIAVDNQNVYWTTRDGKVMRVPKASTP